MSDFTACSVTYQKEKMSSNMVGITSQLTFPLTNFIKLRDKEASLRQCCIQLC